MTINPDSIGAGYPEEGVEDDTLGPCGCIDYHMADCDLMVPASRFDGMDPGDQQDRWYGDDY